MLTDQQIERYSRQIILPHVGGLGQERLLAASVAVVGEGRIAMIASHYLAAAGVGTVQTSAAIMAALADVNPDCRLQALPACANRASADALVAAHSVMVAADALDDTTALLNAACIAREAPLLWAHAQGCVAWLAVFAGYRSDAACFACRRESTPTLPDVVTALHEAAAAFIGAAAATEAIKLILDLETTLITGMLHYDARTTTIGQIQIIKDPRCACASRTPARGSVR